MLIKKIKKACLIALTLLFLSSSTSSASIDITRISGHDRFDTAINVNDNFINYADNNNAVLSNGNEFKNSLYGSYIASTLRIPFYLNSGSHGIKTKILNELANKKVNHVYILGDYKSMDKSIDNTLLSKNIKFTRIYDKVKFDSYNQCNYVDSIPVYILGDYKSMDKSIDNTLLSKNIKFTRIYDKVKFDSYNQCNYVDSIPEQANSLIYDAYHKNEPLGDIGSCIIINDNKFPDMLSAIPFVSQTAIYDSTKLFNYKGFDSMDGFQFIIGGFDSVPAYIKTFMGTDAPGLNDHHFTDPETGDIFKYYSGRLSGKDRYETATEIAKAYEIVGTDAPGLNDHHFTDPETGDIFKYYSGRLSGKDRYETATEIAKAYEIVLEMDVSNIILVNGENFPDALTSGIASVYTQAPVLLTQSNKLNQYTKDYLKTHPIKNVIIVGGENSVSRDIEKEIRELK